MFGEQYTQKTRQKKQEKQQEHLAGPSDVSAKHQGWEDDDEWILNSKTIVSNLIIVFLFFVFWLVHIDADEGAMMDRMLSDLNGKMSDMTTSKDLFASKPIEIRMELFLKHAKNF